MPGSFFDTNVVLYAASADHTKADRAEALLGTGGTISVQVLTEVANVARRKMRLSWAETRTLLGTLQAMLTVHPVTIDVHTGGLALAERYGLSVYDAMIAAAAMEAECDTLWSEGMQDGLVLSDRLRIVNPFRGRA